MTTKPYSVRRHKESDTIITVLHVADGFEVFEWLFCHRPTFTNDLSEWVTLSDHDSLEHAIAAANTNRKLGGAN